MTKIDRRAFMALTAAPVAMMATPSVAECLTRREQIEHHAEAILRLVEQDAPESERGASCRVSRGADGRARFDAQMLDGSMAMLNPQTMAWV